MYILKKIVQVMFKALVFTHQEEKQDLKHEIIN